MSATDHTLTDAEDVLLAEWWVNEGGDHEDLALDSLTTAVESILAARLATAEAEKEALRRDNYLLSARLSLPACICEEGPYFGAQMVGTPLRCERCWRDETQNPEAALAGLVAAIEALAGKWASGLWPTNDGGTIHSRQDERVASDLRALLTADHAAALRAEKAKAWDEGALAMLRAHGRWGEKCAPNPYRADAATEKGD